MSYKVGHLVGAEWVEQSHTPVFRMPKPEEQAQRIAIGVPSRNTEVFYRLVSSMPPPYLLLYVLHTPRGESSPGRYQSPELTSDEFKDFYETFSEFLSSDARFDLWAHAPEEESTIVWERHNLGFAYGRSECFRTILVDMGFHEGTPVVPSPHEHHYHPEFDLKARELLGWFDWSVSPLRPGDEQ